MQNIYAGLGKTACRFHSELGTRSTADAKPEPDGSDLVISVVLMIRGRRSIAVFAWSSRTGSVDRTVVDDSDGIRVSSAFRIEPKGAMSVSRPDPKKPMRLQIYSDGIPPG